MHCMMCGSEISGHDTVCPNCGAPTNYPLRTAPLVERPSSTNRCKKKKSSKAILIVLLCTVILLGITLIGLLIHTIRSQSVHPPLTSPSSVAQTGETSAPTTATVSDTIKTDEKLLTVEITLPASLYEGVDMSDFDTSAYCAEYNFISTTVNEDGSITIVMTKARHRELIDEMGKSTEEFFEEFIEAEDTPYIKEITHNSDFSVVDIKVVRAEYENSFDMTPFSVGITVMFNQAFWDMDPNCAVNIIDVETGEIINTVIFPYSFDE